MTSSLRIGIIALLSIFFALSLLAIFLNVSESRGTIETQREIKFYNEFINSNEKNVFLLGSSHVGRLNSTVIHELITKNGFDVKIFNMAKAHDLPSQRLKALDALISTNPEIIVYGLGHRDFGYNLELVTTTNSNLDSINCKNKDLVNLLPEIKFPIYHTVQTQFQQYDFSKFKESKQNTIALINNIIEKETGGKNYTYNISSPFYISNSITDQVVEEKDLERLFQIYCYIKNDNDRLKQVTAINQILNKLQEHNIKVILFITPHDKFFLEQISYQDQKNFNDTIKKIYQDFELEQNSLLKKYHGLNVWQHINHISTNSSVSIFNEDVSKMIMDKLS